MRRCLTAAEVAITLVAAAAIVIVLLLVRHRPRAVEGA